MGITRFCICFLLFLSGCGVNSGAGDETFMAIVNGKLNYDYGKPVTHEEIVLTSHAQNCYTDGISHGKIIPGALGQFSEQLVRSSTDPIRCLKFHWSGTTVEVETMVEVRKSEPFKQVDVSAAFNTDNQAVNIINKTGHSIVVDLAWYNMDQTFHPKDIPLDQVALPRLQPEDSFEMRKNEINGEYEEERIDFFFYEVVEDTAYYRDIASSSMNDQFYIYYSDDEVEQAYYPDITCPNNCAD